jgi:hypothetical protein
MKTLVFSHAPSPSKASSDDDEVPSSLPLQHPPSICESDGEGEENDHYMVRILMLLQVQN